MKQPDPFSKKLALLEPWHRHIIEKLKKDLKREHLSSDKAFWYRHFKAKRVEAITVDDLIAVYSKQAAEDEKLAEFIANRWLLKNFEIYNFFEAKLKALSNDMESITAIDDAFAEAMLAEGKTLFPERDIYLFSVLNSVAFSPKILDELKKKAASHA